MTKCDVVIATRNRPEALRRCLDGLRLQELRDFGVIVVDDASDDPVEEWLTAAQREPLNLRVVTLSRQSGPAGARNRGVAASTAEFISFIDDDVVPDWRLLATHAAAIARAEAESDRPAVSCGPFVEPADWQPTPWNLWEARQAKHEADSMMRGVYAPTWRQFHTGNNMLRRELFLRAGGFDADYKRAEDDEFALRLHQLGARFVFEPQAIAWHYAVRTLEAWLAIPRAYAHFDVRIDRSYPREGYLEKKRDELRQRHPVLRWMRAVTSVPGTRGVAIRMAARAATMAYGRGRIEPAMALLSIAYDLSYVDALAAELKAAPPTLPDLRTPVDGHAD